MDRILQSEFNRVFEEIRRPSMNPSMYNKLENMKLGCVWEVIRSEILPKLIDNGYYLVPYPDEANDYDLFNAFIKVYECCCGKLLGKPRRYRHVTKLQQVAEPVEEDVFTYSDNEAFGLPKDYVHESAGRNVDGSADKSLLFIVRGTSKVSGGLNHIKKNELVVCRPNAALGRSKIVYVINEVIVANSVIIRVAMGDKKKRWEFKGPIPLAFKFVKFRMHIDGHLSSGSPYQILPRWSDKEVIEWERPSETKNKIHT